jgi:ribosomal protein RSM22 (predicted rRNA methylase)
MIAPDLPAELKAAIDARLHGRSRSAAAATAAAISRTYRAGGGSAAIRSENDALAYALARMPATYAAVAASLNALCASRPGFAPASLLDVGAGPGTASWAAAAAFASLQAFTLLDSNAPLRELGLELCTASSRLRGSTYRHGDARALLAQIEPAALVVASYVIGESVGTERAGLAELMWARTRDSLLIVEPGTPAGYNTILALRQQLIASGAHVTAPCPHERSCPLTPPDWCHFSQRLPRSRAHRQVKAAELGYEDEKFAYVVLSRAAARARGARVLAQPDIGKVEVSAKLCTADGLVTARVPRRDRAGYARARRWRWGDAIMDDA